jgi:hypothetical protein
MCIIILLGFIRRLSVFNENQQHFRGWFYFDLRVRGQNPTLFGPLVELVSTLDMLDSADVFRHVTSCLMMWQGDQTAAERALIQSGNKHGF